MVLQDVPATSEEILLVLTEILAVFYKNENSGDFKGPVGGWIPLGDFGAVCCTALCTAIIKTLNGLEACDGTLLTNFIIFFSLVFHPYVYSMSHVKIHSLCLIGAGHPFGRLASWREAVHVQSLRWQPDDVEPQKHHQAIPGHLPSWWDAHSQDTFFFFFWTWHFDDHMLEKLGHWAFSIADMNRI